MAINGLGVVSGSYATTGFVEAAVGLAPSPPTSIANSGGSASLSGNTVSFSGVSSVSLNGCFTGDYDNYRVFVNGVSSIATAASNPMRWRYRSGGSDKTASIYYNQGVYSTNSAGPSRYYNATESSATAGWMGDEAFGNSFDVIRPFGTARKKQIVGHAHAAGSSTAISAQFSGWLNEAYSADGFTIYQDSGTFTGTLSVYGYKK